MRPRIFAHVFGDDDFEKQETESLQQELRSRGVPVERDWPNRFTYGRGGGPELGPALVTFGIAVTLATWYGQGFVGEIGAGHARAIKETIGAWLAQKKANDFYLCVLSANGQQVRAGFPSDPPEFQEAFDALDSAFMGLPSLAPETYCTIEWDAERHRWTVELG